MLTSKVETNFPSHRLLVTCVRLSIKAIIFRRLRWKFLSWMAYYLILLSEAGRLVVFDL